MTSLIDQIPLEPPSNLQWPAVPLPDRANSLRGKAKSSLLQILLSAGVIGTVLATAPGALWGSQLQPGSPQGPAGLAAPAGTEPSGMLIANRTPSAPGYTYTGLNFALNGSWTPAAPLPSARRDVAAAELDDKIYAVGGYGELSPTGHSSGRVDVFDPASQTWSTKSPMPTSRTQHAVAALNGKLYAVGGLGQTGGAPLNLLEEYNPLTDTWTAKAPMPSRRYALAAAAVGGKLYVLGGRGVPGSPPNTPSGATAVRSGGAGDSSGSLAEGPANADDASHPSSDIHSSLSRLVSSLSDAASSLAGIPSSLPEVTTSLAEIASVLSTLTSTLSTTSSNALVSSPSVLILSSVEEYDPETDTWTTKARLPRPRSGLAAVALGGKLYAIGGSDRADVDEYDPLTDAWTIKAPLRIPRTAVAAAAAQGGIYVVGGTLRSHTLNTVELFDPAANTWSMLESLPAKRSGFGVAAAGGHIYAIGGIRGTSRDAVDILPVSNIGYILFKD